MKKSLPITISIIFLSTVALSQPQPPDSLWTQTYGVNDNCSCVLQTSDGGFIISGSVDNSGNTDALLLKIDASGVVEWSQTYGEDNTETASDVIQTDDGGFILIGCENALYEDTDVLVLKTDSMGNEEWSRTYGNHYSYDTGYGIDKTDDGGYVIIGYLSMVTGPFWDIIFCKIDSNGNEIWSNSWDGIGYDIEVTSDGGCIIVGRTSAISGFDVYAKLIKTDASGNLEWEQLYVDSSFTSTGYSVQQTIDGGYIVTGYANEPDTSDYCTNLYLLKVNGNGEEEWSQMFGGIHSDIGKCVQQTFDGGYIIIGLTVVDSSDTDIYLIKTDPFGNELWFQTYGGDLFDVGMSVRQTNDEGYIIASNANSFTPTCIYIIRLGSDNKAGEIYSDGPTEFILFSACPNPFNQSTVISYNLPTASYTKLTVYDITGREVAKLVDGYQSAGIHKITFNADNLTCGVYFVRLAAGEKEWIKKIILMK